MPKTRSQQSQVSIRSQSSSPEDCKDIVSAASCENVTESQQTSTDSTDSSNETNCAVCLEEMVHPVLTPCKHQFCFLCLKGVCLTNGNSCPMCRQSIPNTYLNKPTLLTPPSVKRKRFKSTGNKKSDEEPTSEEKYPYQWFYKGMNGWWRYDVRTNKEIEKAYSEGETSVTLLLAGHNFKIDFKNMYQQKANGQGLMRDIKRDTPNCRAKGTAGLYSSSLLSAGSSNENAKKKKQ